MRRRTRLHLVCFGPWAEEQGFALFWSVNNPGEAWFLFPWIPEQQRKIRLHLVSSNSWAAKELTLFSLDSWAVKKQTRRSQDPFEIFVIYALEILIREHPGKKIVFPCHLALDCGLPRRNKASPWFGPWASKKEQGFTLLWAVSIQEGARPCLGLVCEQP